MKHNFLIPILITFLIFLNSCETEDSINVNQDRIYVAYELFYNQNEDKTVASVVFTFGNRTGTRLKLSEGSNVTFNGTMMSYDDILGLYKIESAGLVEDGSFIFQDLDDTSYVNSTSLKSIGLPETVPNAFDASESHELTWAGDAIETNGEIVTATILPNNVAQIKAFFQASQNATSVVLNTNTLQEIDPQPANLFLERTIESETIDASDVGGIITAKFRTQNVSVQIE